MLREIYFYLFLSSIIAGVTCRDIKWLPVECARMNITPATLTKAFHSTTRWSLKRMMDAHSRQPFLLQTFSTYDDWTAAIAFLQVADRPDLLPTPVCVMADPHTTGDENALPKAAILYDYAHIRSFNWLLNTITTTDNTGAHSPTGISSINKDLMLQIMQLTDYAHQLGFSLPWQAHSHAFLLDKTTFRMLYFDFAPMKPSNSVDLIKGKDWLAVVNLLATLSPWMDEADREAINSLLQSQIKSNHRNS